MTFPEESIQGLAALPQWWEQDEGKTFCRGRLCTAFIPFVVQTPLTLEPVGRPQPTEHHEVDATITPLRIGQSRRMKALPVAAFPLDGNNDLYTVYKAKSRPCLIIGDGCKDFPAELCAGRPGWQKADTVIVAPYFGVAQDGSRAGFPQPFVDRVVRCEFPQYFWDILPHTGKESLLNFMQSQPIGKHHDSIARTKYKLSDLALAVIDEWILWSFTGNPPTTDGPLSEARELLLNL